MATELLADYSDIVDAQAGATTAKNFYLINGKVALAINSAAAGADNVFAYACPKARVPKASGQVWDVLQLIYWDDVAKNFTTVVTSNTLAGVVVSDAASADTEGVIDFSPFA